MRKKLLSVLLAVCLMIPVALSLSACGEPVTIAGNTFNYSSYNSDGYDEVPAAQWQRVTAKLPSVTDEASLAQYITSTLGTTISFGAEPAGYFQNDTESFDYYAIKKDGVAFTRLFWKYYESSETESISFIIINDENSAEHYGALYVSPGDYTVNEIVKINICYGEIEGELLKIQFELQVMSPTSSITHDNLTTYLVIYYAPEVAAQ